MPPQCPLAGWQHLAKLLYFRRQQTCRQPQAPTTLMQDIAQRAADLKEHAWLACRLPNAQAAGSQNFGTVADSLEVLCVRSSVLH